jgi:hypothetical protein
MGPEFQSARATGSRRPFPPPREGRSAPAGGWVQAPAVARGRATADITDILLPEPPFSGGPTGGLDDFLFLLRRGCGRRRGLRRCRLAGELVLFRFLVVRFRDRRQQGFDGPFHAGQGRGEGLLLLHVELPDLQGRDSLLRRFQGLHGALGLRRSLARSFLFVGVDAGLVRLVGREHAPLLLPGGDPDQGPLGDGGVLAALVPDRLGKPVDGEDLRDRGEGPVRDLGHVLQSVALALLEAVQGLGLLHGGEVRADRVFGQRDLLVVGIVGVDGRNRGQARLPGRGAAPLAGDGVEEAALHPKDDGGAITFCRAIEAVSSARAVGSRYLRGWLESAWRSARGMS